MQDGEIVAGHDLIIPQSVRVWRTGELLESVGGLLDADNYVSATVDPQTANEALFASQIASIPHTSHAPLLEELFHGGQTPVHSGVNSEW